MNGLNASQLAAFISTNKLNVAQASLALRAAGVSREQRIQILQQAGLITSNASLTVSLKSVTAALWAQTKAWAASPLGMATIVAVAIFALCKVIKNYADAAREAADANDEMARKSRDKVAEMQDEAATLSELIAKYKELASSETQDSTTRDEIRSIQDDITDLVGMQAKNLDLVNGKLDDEIQKLDDVMKLQAMATLDTATANYHNARKAAKSAMGDDSLLLHDGLVYQGDIEDEMLDALVAAGYKEKTAWTHVQHGLFYDSYTDIPALRGYDGNWSIENLDGTIDEKIEYLNGLINTIKYVEGYAGTELYATLVATRDKFQEYADNQTNAAIDLLESLTIVRTYDTELQNMVVDSADSFQKYRDALISNIKEDGSLSEALSSGDITESDITKHVDAYLASLSKFSKFYKSTTTSVVGVSGVLSESVTKDIDAVQSKVSTLNDALDKLSSGKLDASAVTDLIQEFPELAAYTDLAAKNFGNLEAGLKELILHSPDELISTLEEFANTNNLTSEAKDLIKDLCAALKDLAKVDTASTLSQFEQFVKTLSDTDALDAGFSQLSTIFNDIKDGGDFDWGSILSDDFKQTFGDLGDSYEKFMRTVASSPKNLAACRSAFNELATAYIANSGALDNVTESNRDAVVAMLEQMGVTNAATIVDGQLALGKERLKYASSEYTNMTYAEIQALYNEAMAGSVAKQALAELAVQKYLEENTVIDSTSDIEQLLTLANAANATAESLARVNEAKAIMAQAESAYSQYQSEYRGGDPNQLESYRRYLELKNKANSILSTPIQYKTINPADLIVDFEGVSKAAGNAKDDIESLYDSAKNGIEELIDYRKSMLEKDIENQKDALEEQIDALSDFYDEQREMLEEQYDEEEYLAEQHEKQKAVTDLKGELAMLANDDSAWAQRRKLEIQEELSEAEDELSELEKEHALDVTLDMLDDQQEAQEKQIQDQIDALDAKLNDPHALYNQALSDIRNNTLDLYQEMIEFNRKWGSGNDDDIRDMWNDAYESNEDYRDKTGSTYKDIELGDYAGYDASGVGKVSAVSSTLRKGSKGDGVKALQHALNQLGYGNSGTRSLDGSFGSGTRSAVIAFQRANGLTGDGVVGSATKAKFKALGYATGTDNATPGWHELFEGDLDEYIFTSGDGSRYRMFSGLGDKVLNAGATDFLYQFANSGGSILTQMIADLFKRSGLSNISKPVQAIEVNAGNVIVEGNADMKTVSEIRRAQRENLNFVLKSLNSLNK